MTKATDLTNRQYDAIANKATKEEALQFKATMEATHKVTIVQSGSAKKDTLNFAIWCKARKEAKPAIKPLKFRKSNNGTWHLDNSECSEKYELASKALTLKELPDGAKVCKKCLAQYNH